MSSTGSSPKKVLIVEDDEVIRFVLEENLLSQGYFVSGAVSTGEDAVSRVAHEVPDLILMDVMLEGEWDGITTAERILERNDVPIVFLTCDESNETIERAKITSPFGYLLKPIHARELHATIALALHKAESDRLLRESEEKYRQLVESVNEVIYSLDEKGALTYVSRAIQPLTGFAPEEVLGLPLTALVHPEDLEQAAGALGLGGGTAMMPTDLRILTRTGGTAWVRTHGRPIGGAPEHKGVRGVLTDITELKRTQRELETLNEQLDLQVREKTGELIERNRQLHLEIEERLIAERELRLLHSAVDQSSEGVAILDTSQRVIYANPAFARLHGYSIEEMSGRHISLLSLGEERPPEFEPLENADQRAHLEAWHCRRDGTLFPCLMTRTSFRDSGSRVEGLVLTVKDITDLKQAEGALRESKANLSAFLDAVSEPAFMLDVQGRLLLTNRAASQWFEHDLKCANPLNYFDLLPDALAKEARRFFAEVAARAEPAILERTLGDRIVLHHLYPITDDTGEAIRLAVLAMDVTERRLLEKHFIQSRKMASLGVLVSGLAHEINNPNNFIAFNLPILRDYLDLMIPLADRHAEANPDLQWFGLDYAEFRGDLLRLLENVENGSERINRIVSSLMEFTRDNQPLASVPVDPGRIARESSELLRDEMQGLIRSFELSVAPDLPPLVTDPEALRTLMMQLMLNAVQAAEKPESWVRVSVAKADGTHRGVVIEVADNGRGMDEMTVERVFDPFFTTRDPGQGTGLGLYACHNIVELMGGTIAVESRPHEETVFRVILPNPVRTADSLLEKGVS